MDIPPPSPSGVVVVVGGGGGGGGAGGGGESRGWVVGVGWRGGRAVQLGVAASFAEDPGLPHPNDDDDEQEAWQGMICRTEHPQTRSGSTWRGVEDLC